MASSETRPILDLPDRVAEVLFGLFMALSFTGSIQVSVAGRDEVSPILFAAIGCNIAWGLVDGVMYVVESLVERGRTLRGLRRLADAKSAAAARDVLGLGLPTPVVDLLRVEDLARLRALAADHAAQTGVRLRRDDVRAAVAIALLVIVATFPVVVPYFVVDDFEVAKRVSNAVSIVLIYVCGHILGGYAGGRPIRTGLTMVGLGAVLVSTIIALGG